MIRKSSYSVFQRISNSSQRIWILQTKSNVRFQRRMIQTGENPSGASKFEDGMSRPTVSHCIRISQAVEILQKSLAVKLNSYLIKTAEFVLSQRLRGFDG